jgi:hypothetical protein
MEASLFKLTMHANSKQALEPPLTCSLMTTLWSNMGFSAFLKQRLLEYLKLVELLIVMVLDNVEDKRCFSTTFFMKSKFKNKLTNHFDLVVKMFIQDHYSMDVFPFGDVIKD